ncbi:MAG: 3-hydroxybutyrate oligomer hydrolase family protein, partial [Myxococcaceae bacterium]
DDDRGEGHGHGRNRRPDYRLYEVQNGNHIETFVATFPQLAYIEPHAQQAFDLLVDRVERGQALPASQCIPRGGAISGAPAEPGHCPKLFQP